MINRFGQAAIAACVLVLALAAVLAAGQVRANQVRAGDVITLKAHHFLSATSHTHVNVLLPWAEKVMRESGGRLKVEVYPAMQLGGTPPQLADQARDGVVDIIWTLSGYTPGRFTKTEVFELPFMHAGTVATNLALDEFAERHADEYRDYKIIALHTHPGNSFHSHEPIRTLADIKGKKIRTPTRTGAWMIEAMGAVPIGAPVPKIPEMLSKKIVDAVLIPFEVAVPLKTHEMVDYHTLLDDPEVTRINTSVFLFAMNRARYDSLPADLKKVIDNNSGRNIARRLGEGWNVSEAKGEALAAASGEVIRMAPAEVARLRAATERPVIDRWIAEMKEKGVDGAALVEEARALLAQHAD